MKMNDTSRENEKEFYTKFDNEINKKNYRQNFTREKLNRYINICKKKIAQNAQEYYILNRYAVTTTTTNNNNNDNEEEKDFVLIDNENYGKKRYPPPIYITIDEIYKYIQQAHHRTAHSGIKNTLKEVKTMVINVTFDHVKYFISLCFFCQNIKNKNKKNAQFRVKSPIISNRFNQRAQVDLIDIRNLCLGNCRYLLNYQDNLTKFCILKSLSDKKNTVQPLLEIFNLFGAPKILHSDNGGEFRGREFVKYFQRFWPELKMVKGKPYNPRSQGSVERANQQIKNLILACIHNNSTYDNVENIIHNVQYIKNTTYNRTIKCSPYNALFGQDIVVKQNIEKNFDDPNDDDDDDHDETKKTDVINRCEDVMSRRHDVFTNVKLAAQKLTK